jgi:hexosaminidase
MRNLLISLAMASSAFSQTVPQVVPAVQSWAPAGTSTVQLNGKVVSESPAFTEFTSRLLKDLAQIGNTGASDGVAISLKQVNLPKLGDEGYQIDISSPLTLSANSTRGLFYASRTLLQMLRAGNTLPSGTIIDYPTSKGRMLMLDVGRKPFPIPVLQDYIRMMAWYKMNELHLHFSDEAFGGSYAAFRIESDVFPGLAAKDFSYTKKEIRELQDFAKDYGITITPEFDMPGHARCFTNYWPETMLKGFPNYVDVTNPKTIENLKKLLDEMIPLFDAPDIHIGTDEYRVGDRPDLHEAFRQFINTMNAHIRSRGKNCRIWSGFEHMKGSTQIEPSVIIDMWETDDAKGQIAKGHKIINSNHGRTYIVPGCHYYGISCAGIYQGWEPWMVSGDNAKNPTKDDPNLLGGKLHVWADQGPTGYTHQEIADLTLPGIQAFAEKLWGTKGSPDYQAFTKRSAATLPIPAVSVLDRLPANHPNDIILDLPQEQTLADPNSVIPLPLADAPRADLEYPWTLTMEVCKTVDTGKRGVILSSDLAEICSDYSVENEVKTTSADGTEQKTKVKVNGVGTIRAAGARIGKDPLDTYKSRDVSNSCGKPLELNRWTTVTITGNARSSTIYIDGVKAGNPTNNQMICPLRWIGSTTGNSFVGKIRKLRVINRILSPKEIGRAAGLDIPDNLAEKCKVSATKSYPSFQAVNITDGDPSTRWSSGDGQEGIVTVDLGSVKSIDTIRIFWETAYAKEYELAVSSDGRTWKTVFTGEGTEGQSTAKFATVSTRHIRVTGLKAATGFGYSIWELEAYAPR